MINGEIAGLGGYQPEIDLMDSFDAACGIL